MGRYERRRRHRTLGRGHRPDRPLRREGCRRRRAAAAAPARTGRPRRPRRHVLAGVQGEREGACPRTPPSGPPGRAGRPRPGADAPGGGGRHHRSRGRRRPAAPVGARHRPRLPRPDLQLARRRTGAQGHRADHRPLGRGGDRTPARPGLLVRAPGRRGAPHRADRPRRAPAGRGQRCTAHASQALRRRRLRRSGLADPPRLRRRSTPSPTRTPRTTARRNSPRPTASPPRAASPAATPR